MVRMEQFLLGQLLLVLLVAAGAAASSSSEMWVVHSSFYTTFPRSQITETSVQYSTVSAPLLPSPPPSTHLTPSQSPPHTTSPSIRSSSPGAGSTSSSVPFPSPKLESDKNFRLLLYTVPPLAFVLVVVTTLFLVLCIRRYRRLRRYRHHLHMPLEEMDSSSEGSGSEGGEDDEINEQHSREAAFVVTHSRHPATQPILAFKEEDT